MTDVISDIIFGVGVGMLSDVMIGVGVDILTGMETIAMDTLEFVGEVARAAVDVLTGLIVDVVSVNDVDMLTDENENLLATVMTPLEFTLPTP